MLGFNGWAKGRGQLTRDFKTLALHVMRLSSHCRVLFIDNAQKIGGGPEPHFPNKRKNDNCVIF